jgi:TetR/AcrR family transcriptional regulator
MTRVLIGDALVNEDERLQLRMNQFYDRVELALKQALRLAASEGQAHEADTTGARRDADQLCHRTLAPLRQERLQNNPSQDAALHITLLLS